MLRSAQGTVQRLGRDRVHPYGIGIEAKMLVCV